jgi:hypothetical protein
MQLMLGWHITIYRFGDSTLRLHRGDLDATLALLTTATGRSEVPKSTDADHRLAVWQAALGGTDWLRGLVESRRAALTGGGGYPDTYLIRCQDFRARLEAGLPYENTTWISGPHDVLDPQRWLGRTTIDGEQLARCAPDEWLLAEVWDES